MKTLVILAALALSACAGTTIDAPDQTSDPAPAPSSDPAPADGFYFDHVLAGYEGCQDAVSTDPSKVELRGPSCTADGSACADIANNRVEVWKTPAAESGSPFGAASFVETDSCDPPAK